MIKRNQNEIIKRHQETIKSWKTYHNNALPRESASDTLYIHVHIDNAISFV